MVYGPGYIVILHKHVIYIERHYIHYVQGGINAPPTSHQIYSQSGEVLGDESNIGVYMPGRNRVGNYGGILLGSHSAPPNEKPSRKGL